MVKLEGRCDMTRPQLILVQNVEITSTPLPFSQMLTDHHAILQGYLDTHTTRNHSDRTIETERRFLTGWFESFVLQDDEHPDGQRQLLVWEAMEPAQGRQRIVAFSKGLVDAGLRPRTVHGYLGSLRRLFQYTPTSPVWRSGPSFPSMVGLNNLYSNMTTQYIRSIRMRKASSLQESNSSRFTTSCACSTSSRIRKSSPPHVTTS